MASSSSSTSPGNTPEQVSRVYANVNDGEKITTEYLENLTLTFDQCSNYKFKDQCISSGSFACVYEGVSVQNGQKVVLKKFHNEVNRKWLINKEILCLKKLKDKANVVQLLAVLQCPLSQYPSLVLEYICTDFEEVYFDLNEQENRYYLKELLKALDCCHSMGIMHRDLKPANIVIDRKQKILRLVDFGASDFYYPGYQYKNTGTEVYQPPEALFEWAIDYSVDMWSFGVIIAEMHFKISPFFERPTISKIFKVFGQNKWNDYSAGNLKSTEDDDSISLESFIPKGGAVSPQTIDLIKNLLKYNPSERLTAKEAIGHNYFL